MTSETAERKPAVGFDVKKIAERFNGWELIQPDPKRSPDYWVLRRETPDGRQLVLGLKPEENLVYLREYSDNNLDFTVSCKDIEFVDIESHNVTFMGNVQYGISNNGQFHDVRTPSLARDIIATRNYHFSS